jgi:hypothetical protein
MTDHPRFKGDDAIPKEFIYRGSMIFLTNKDFQKYIDHGVGKYVPHMEAFMSRSLYLDLKMHTKRDVAWWIEHLTTRHRVLQLMGGISAEEEKMLVSWIMANKDNIRQLSLRTAINLGKVFKRNKSTWKKTAEILFIKQ